MKACDLSGCHLSLGQGLDMDRVKLVLHSTAEGRQGLKPRVTFIKSFTSVSFWGKQQLILWMSSTKVFHVKMMIRLRKKRQLRPDQTSSDLQSALTSYSNTQADLLSQLNMMTYDVIFNKPFLISTLYCVWTLQSKSQETCRYFLVMRSKHDEWIRMADTIWQSLFMWQNKV